MACIKRIEQGSRLNSPNFSENVSVGTESKRVFQQVIERDVRLEGIRLRSRRNYIGLPNMKFRGIFDDNYSLILGNKVRQYSQMSCLPRSRSTAD